MGLEGATVVIHAASIVDVCQPSEIAMNAVNVKGTENIIRVCLECSVTRLVYTSTADVVLGWSDNHNINEATPFPGDNVSDYLFGLYAYTKMKAERKVLEASGTKCANENLLIACVLRPLLMYGEGDKVFLPNLISAAKSQLGYLPRMGMENSKTHMCYVGNAAWAHVVAVERMATCPNLVGGKAFFIGDNTPVNSLLDSAEPFLAATGCKLLSFSIPYSILIVFAVLLEWVSWILRPFCSFHVSLTRSSVFHVCKGSTISWKNAKDELGYLPIFSYQESKVNTMRYLVARYVNKT